MVISGTGTTATHATGYSLTYFHNIAHGRANALLLTAFLQFCSKTVPKRVNEILAACGCSDPEEL